MSEQRNNDKFSGSDTPFILLLLIVMIAATSFDSCRQSDRIRDLEWRVDTLEKLRR